MRRLLAAVVSLLSLVAFAGVAAAAPTPDATVDPSQIPDGTYTVTVEKVVDPQHVLVVMPGDMKTELAAVRASISFAKVKSGDSLKISTGKGKILVFLDLTSQ
ncbi:MAG TPA: hypothetical protein VNJ51_07700 [Candidatus Dormibacteraeota bacterium]|nr:hypothetical protein [Candidatus Dormibacteraeota bacterium]